MQPGSPSSDLERAVNEAQAQLDQLLAELGVADLDEARESRQARAKAEQQRWQAEQTLERALDGASLEELERHTARIAEQVKDLESDQRHTGDERQESADAEELAQAVKQAEDAEDAAEAEAKEATRRREETREKESLAQETAVRASAAVEAATDELQRQHDQLTGDRERNSDEELREVLEELRRDVAELQQTVDAEAQAIEELEPELLEMQLANAEAAEERSRRDREAMELDRSGVRALLDDRSGSGVYDRLADAQASLEQAAQQHRSIRSRAQAAKLLWETLEAKRQVAQQRYVAPFKERIDRLGRLVFGSDFDVEISQELDLVSRTLNGRTVPFDSLSSGAKEQLSVIGRLAAAQLVGTDGGGPVILDDALGFADAQRLERLGAVLNHVGDTAQVVLLTCQPERYAAVGNAKVVRLPAS